MKLSVQEFLDSVTNKQTKKGYKNGIKKFTKWFGKSAEEILQIRKDDLTQIAGENLIEYKNKASRFEKEIEKFHADLLKKYSINTARNYTLGIRQLFRFYEMPIRFRTGSKISKTVKTTKNFPLTIEHIRRMYAFADLRERVILSMATDLGLRIGDFVSLKKKQLPPTDQEPPISFEIMTDKEKVVAHGFLSKETVNLLKVYLPTLESKSNEHLFPSNGKSHISDEWVGKLLKRLAKKAKINLNGKKLTFHCFRKMFLSASIDSGIGLTAGKMLCGKAIRQSDDTYLTTVKLRKKFIQLKNYLTIKEQPKIELENIESLKKAISKLQEDLGNQRTITNVISDENQEIKKQLSESEKELNMVSDTILNRIIPIVDLFDSIEGLEEFLIQFKDKKTKLNKKTKKDLTKQLVEAGKKREEHLDRKFKRFTQFDEVEYSPKDKDQKE
jgi:integrase